MMDFLQCLGRERLFFDGAMGTLLQSRGLASGELPEIWNITKPDVISDIHKAYVDSGCNILKTNTLGANSLKLAETGYSVRQALGLQKKPQEKMFLQLLI